MPFCKVFGCGCSNTHITSQHICELCGESGHGPHECNNLNLRQELSNNPGINELPIDHYCQYPMCPRPGTHMSIYHDNCVSNYECLNILIQKSKSQITNTAEFSFLKHNVYDIFEYYVKNNNNRNMKIYTTSFYINDEIFYARLKDVIHTNSEFYLNIEYIHLHTSNLNATSITRNMTHLRDKFIDGYELLDYEANLSILFGTQLNTRIRLLNHMETDDNDTQYLNNEENMESEENIYDEEYTDDEENLNDENILNAEISSALNEFEQEAITNIVSEFPDMNNDDDDNQNNDENYNENNNENNVYRINYERINTFLNNLMTNYENSVIITTQYNTLLAYDNENGNQNNSNTSSNSKIKCPMCRGINEMDFENLDIDQSTETDCIICCEKKPKVILTKCKHSVICPDCFEEYKQYNQI